MPDHIPGDTREAGSVDNFHPSLDELARLEEPTDLIVSGFLKRSRTFRIYDTMMRHLRIPGRYRPFELPRVNGEPDRAGLASLVSFFREHHALRSLVVSDPYKLPIFDLLDQLEARAVRTGAVNLVTRKAGMPVGDNLDGEAFCLGARQEWGEDFEGRRMFLFGCGGVSAAVATAAAPRLKAIGLTDLIPSRTRSLADRLKTVAPHLQVHVYDRGGRRDLRGYDVLYNGTGLGKYSDEAGATDRTPLRDDDLLPSEGLAIDANYTPWRTRFLEALVDRGFSAMNGYPHMLSFVTLHLSIIGGRKIRYAEVKRLAETL